MGNEEKSLKRISFSTLKSYNDCGWYVKLVKIDKIRDKQASVKQHFGTLLHQAVQDALTGTEKKKAIKVFLKKGVRYGKLWRKYIDFEKNNLKNILLAGKFVIENIQERLEDKFGKFEVVCVEDKLEFDTEFVQKFVGYIDLIIKTQDENYHIIDIKTCDSSFFFNKYRDKYKDYQLTLYKHFYSKKFDIDLKKIHTHFLLFERNPKSKTIITFIPVTSGKVKIHNALSWMNKVLELVSRDIFLKNREHCSAFGRKCSFWGTENCPINK